jgi:hypothetical protein
MMMGSVDLIETNMKVTVLIQRIWGDIRNRNTTPCIGDTGESLILRITDGRSHQLFLSVIRGVFQLVFR